MNIEYLQSTGIPPTPILNLGGSDKDLPTIV